MRLAGKAQYRWSRLTSNVRPRKHGTQVLARLSYALIGFLFGAAVGALLWWLYGTGVGSAPSQTRLTAGLGSYVKYVGLACAVVGFVLKDRVGDFAGTIINQVLNFEAGFGRDWSVPGWLVVLVGAAVVFLVWHYAA